MLPNPATMKNLKTLGITGFFIKFHACSISLSILRAQNHARTRQYFLRNPLKKSPPWLSPPCMLLFGSFWLFRQADDQKQDAGDRLARAIIRAEPPDHPSLVLLSLLRPTRLRGVSPPHGEPSTAQKQGEKPFQTLKTLFRSLRFVFKRSSFYKHIKLLLFIQNPFIGISDTLK